MRYLLTVLTNGRSEYLERALAAFEEHVTPRPAAAFVHIDGPHPLPRPLYDGALQWDVGYAGRPVGFTMGTKDCMDFAAGSELEWFFHLEDDFVLLRPLDLNWLREVLEAEQHVKQMALVRTPWGAEIEHGGYIAKEPGWYTRRETVARFDDRQPVRARWIETTRNFATNPALAATAFPREHPYPSVALSEGVYGFEIRDREPEATFGLWGWGEPWCAHIGVERQQGSHGY